MDTIFELKFDLYDLSEPIIDALFEHVLSKMEIKNSTDGIVIYSEWGNFEKKITFNDMVKLEQSFWLDNDPKYMNHNMQLMKDSFMLAFDEITNNGDK